MHGFIIALLAAASYAQNNITEARPSEIVWSEERLGEFARGNRFGGRRHETVGSLAADRGARAYLGLRPQARCKAFVRLGATSDGGRQACVRGVDQAAADALQCAWRFDSRWCKGFPAKVAPEEVRRADPCGGACGGPAAPRDLGARLAEGQALRQRVRRVPGALDRQR